MDGLQYLRARYYDPQTMSFISADSYRGKLEDPLSQNRYIYCHNNPYKYDDPSGHTSLKAQLAQSIFGIDGGGSHSSEEQNTESSSSSTSSDIPGNNGGKVEQTGIVPTDTGGQGTTLPVNDTTHVPSPGSKMKEEGETPPVAENTITPLDKTIKSLDDLYGTRCVIKDAPVTPRASDKKTESITGPREANYTGTDETFAGSNQDETAADNQSTFARIIEMGKELISSTVDTIGNIVNSIGIMAKNTVKDIVNNPVEFFNGLGFSSAMFGGILLAAGDKLTGGWVSRAAIASYGGATLFGVHEIASGDVEEGVKDLASTAISAAGAMASSGVTVNINSTPSTGINLSSSGAATLTPSLIPGYSLSFSTSGSAIAIDQSMIFAQMTTGSNGGYTKPSDDTQESLLKNKDKNDINKKFNNGKEGEQELSRLFGGEDQVYFKTSKGGRYIDQLSDGITHESKVGYTSLSKGVKTQILKDIELINMGQIEGSHWHFFTSGVTGKGGGSKPLIDFLTQNRIPFTRH